MKPQSKSKKKIALEIAMFSLTIYFFYYAINGTNAFLTLLELNKNLNIAHSQSMQLLKETSIYKSKNKGLYESNIDLDVLEEQAKETLGFARLDEIIVVK